MLDGTDRLVHSLRSDSDEDRAANAKPQVDNSGKDGEAEVVADAGV